MRRTRRVFECVFYWTVLILLFQTVELNAQNEVKVMNWNLLRYYTSSTDRTLHFTAVVDSIQPDVLVVQELNGSASADTFHLEVLNRSLKMAEFIDGPDMDNALFYDSTEFVFTEYQAIPTAYRDLSRYSLTHLPSGHELYVYSLHLKSGSSSAFEADRSSQIDSLRKNTDALPIGSNFIVCGDFNIYGDDEEAYRKLLFNNGGDGHLNDALTMTGTWNDPSYSEHHTQSTRTRSFGSGASGGLDDRFDMILFSSSASNPGGVEYVNGSLEAFGNDGQHYNDSINHPPNLAVGQEIANALHYASDHLPVVAGLRFNNDVGVNERIGDLPFSVYPNPSTGPVTIKANDVNQAIVRIYDVLGALIHEVNPTLEKTRFELSGESGLYFLEYTNGSEVYRTKLIKR